MKHNEKKPVKKSSSPSTSTKGNNRRHQEGLGEDEQKLMQRKDIKQMNKDNKGNADQGNRSSNPPSRH